MRVADPLPRVHRLAGEPGPSAPLICLSGVSKVYPAADGASSRQGADGVVALADLSLEVGDGEFLAIVGPSGCGKSTLLQLIAGLAAPTRGRISVAGEPVSGARGDIGLMFQSPVLLPWRTVLQNVLLPARARGLDRRAYTQRALELLRWVGLAGFEHSYPVQLSGGMRQRAALVRALLLEPRILLMDEPFSALDALTREAMQMDLARLWSERRCTVVFTTHQISEAVFLADRVVAMSPRPGRVVDEIPVPLPRPRTVEVMGTAQFAALCNRIREVLARHAGYPETAPREGLVGGSAPCRRGAGGVVGGPRQVPGGR